MFYDKYKYSRDLTWKVLIQNNITELPFNVSLICKNYGIKVLSYKQAKSFIISFGYDEYCKKNDGFTYNGTIFYNEQCDIKRNRFTVAHELGHCLLHNGKGLYNREPSPNDNPIEAEANIFASRLLAPACVLWGLGVRTADEVKELCNISDKAAQYRMERMNILYARENQFVKKYGKSCFLMSPLEIKVYHQFEDFINKHKL